LKNAPIVERAFREAIDAAADGRSGVFLTLEATGDKEKWVQLTWDAINAAYPFKEHPSELLKRRGIALPDLVEISAWEPGQYVTFEHGADPLAPLVQFVERYLTDILGLVPGESSLSVSRGE
jgi:hypothetical protein